MKEMERKGEGKRGRMNGEKGKERKSVRVGDRKGTKGVRVRERGKKDREKSPKVRKRES